MGTRIFVGTKTALTRDARDSWTFNRDDQVKNIIRISETTVTFEPGDNVAISGGMYVMDWFEFEMMTRELPEQAKGRANRRQRSPVLSRLFPLVVRNNTDRAQAASFSKQYSWCNPPRTGTDLTR